jgi:hypothetical protein
MATLAAVLALAAGPALAHHSFAMFDRSRLTKLEGTVVEFQWANPHSHILLSVPEANAPPGLAGKWDIEANAPNIMIRQGWKKTTLKPGDKVVAYVYPLKNGSPGAHLLRIHVDGRELYIDVDRPAVQ